MCNNENATKYWSSRQESYIAKLLNGYVQPGSGAGKFKKSDVVAGNCLVECKTATTAKNQFTIKKDWLEKLHGEALSNHKDLYALAFNFGAEEKHNFFILNEQTFKLLKEFYEKNISE